ncbi:MAG: HlyD family efflux transporter periplasmic adaptor subunit [Chloroflexi bacterium]|nr:HlyD family efflux transporter periplasmic adaptor subunit [Chloroflexota bacterium]
MKIRTMLLALGIVAVGLPVGYAGYTRVQAGRAPQTAEQPVIQVRPSDTAITASGSLQAEQVASLSFLVSGQVTDIAVAEGDSVTLGQPLMRLDGRQQYLALDQANLSYGLSEVAYQDLQTVDDSDVHVAEANVASAQANYSSVANTVTSADIAAAELQVQQAQAALDGAEQARRMGNPAVSGDAGVTLLDAQVGAASFNLQIAQLRLDDLRSAARPQMGAAAARITQAQAQADQVKAGPSAYQLQQAQTTIDQAAVSLDQAQLAFERTTLRAPFVGVVAQVNVEVGQRVTPSTVVLQLVDLEPLTLHGEVDEIDLPQVQIGMNAQVTVDALTGITFPGVVTRIAPDSRNSGGITVYDVDIQLQTTDARLHPGMSADAALVISQ